MNKGTETYCMLVLGRACSNPNPVSYHELWNPPKVNYTSDSMIYYDLPQAFKNGWQITQNAYHSILPFFSSKETEQKEEKPLEPTTPMKEPNTGPSWAYLDQEEKQPEPTTPIKDLKEDLLNTDPIKDIPTASNISPFQKKPTTAKEDLKEYLLNTDPISDIPVVGNISPLQKEPTTTEEDDADSAWEPLKQAQRVAQSLIKNKTVQTITLLGLFAIGVAMLKEEKQHTIIDIDDFPGAISSTPINWQAPRERKYEIIQPPMA